MWLAIVLLGSQSFGATPFEDLEEARSTKDWPRVIILLKKTPTLIPDSTKWLTLAYLHTGRREEALRALSSQSDPSLWRIAGEQFLSDESEARTNAAVQALRADRTDAAVRDLGEALRIDPKHPMILARLGQAFMMSGRTEEAAEQLRNSVRLNPFIPQAKWLLGRCLWMRGEKAEARQLLESVLKERDPPDWALLWIAEVRLSERHHKKVTTERLKKALSRSEFFVVQSDRREASWNFFNPTKMKATALRAELESLLKQTNP